jgi:4-amino-4-deoxy-L-arabinose transferase-like glycosyltransferase
MTKWPRVRRPALFLLSLCLLTFFLGLGRPAVADADEAFYAEAAREMLERGDWLTPYYNYEHRWQKPVLYYWLTAVTYVVLGVGEWGARLWSALSGVGLVFATYAAGRRLTQHDDVGWLAGAIAATCFGYMALARMALPDLPLAFFITVTIASALEGRWAIAGVAAGLGFLVKGPLAVVLPAIVFAPVWWRERATFAVRPRDLAAAAALFAIVGLPWYVAMTAAHGTPYLESFFVGDNLERFATARFNEPRSPFFFVPVLLGGLLPWTPYALVTAWRPVREIAARRIVMTGTEWRLLLWAAMPFLFFSISIGKQPRYILPVLPPVAILLARAILARLDGAWRGERRALRDLRLATLATAALVAAIAVLLVRARALFITAIPALTWAAVVVLAGCAAALAAVARPRWLPYLPVVMPVCAAMTLVSVQFGALGGRRPEPVEQMAALVARHRTGNERVGEYHVFVRNMVFYTGFAQHELFTVEEAAAFMQSPGRVLMIVADTDLPRLETIAGVRMSRLGDVRYINTANLKLPQLLAPLPRQDIQNVLLVSNR